MKLLEQRDRLGGYTINRHVRSGSTGQLYLGRRIAGPGFAPTIILKVLTESLKRLGPSSFSLCRFVGARPQFADRALP